MLIRKTLLVLTICLTLAGTASAQFRDRGGDDRGGFGGPPSPDRMFGFMDRNQNGRIDPDEAQSIQGPFRDMMTRAGVDLSRGISRDDFSRVMTQAFDQMRRDREAGGSSRSDFGRGSDSSRGDSGRGSDSGRSDSSRGDSERRDSERGDSSRSGSSSNSTSQSSSSGSSSRSSAPTKRTFTNSVFAKSSKSSGSGSTAATRPQNRVTVSLPAAWQPFDTNFDGQIGLYEFDRTKYAEFVSYDLNGDGLLTAREIVLAKASPSGTAPASSAPVSAGPAAGAPGTVSPGLTPAPATTAATPAASAAVVPGKPLAPVAVDPESSDGRMAKFIFRRLDKNSDGSLTADEWEQSQSIRQSFDKFSTTLSIPADYDRFAGLYVAVQQAEKAKK